MKTIFTRLLTFAVAIIGSSLSQVSAQPPGDMTSVSGVVINNETKKPIPGAVVTLFSTTLQLGQSQGSAPQVWWRWGRNQVRVGRRQVTIEGWAANGPGAGKNERPIEDEEIGSVVTDADGKFVFTSIIEGEYWLNIQARGMLSKLTEQLIVDATKPPKLERMLDPLKYIYGRILKEDGTPLGPAKITVNLTPKTRAVYGGPRIEPVSDIEGRFHLLFHQAGEHTLSILVTNIGYIGPITIHTKSGRDLDLGDLRLKPVGSISGRVQERRSGKPIPGAAVNSYSSGSLLMANSDNDGRFTLTNCPAGSYRLDVSAPRHFQPSSRPFETVYVKAGENLQDVILELSTIPRVSGRITFPDNVPFADQNNVWIGFMSCGPSSVTPTGVRLNTNADGIFSFDARTFRPNRFGYTRFSLWLPDIGFGVRDFWLEDGKDIDNLEIKLRPLVDVRGLVRRRGDKEPIAGADVRLMMSNLIAGFGPARTTWEATTDDKGEFLLAGVPPGRRLSIYATANGVGQTRNHLHIRPGDEVEEAKVILEIEATPSKPKAKDGKKPLPGGIKRAALGSISGWVRDAATDAPLAHALVTIQDPATGMRSPSEYIQGLETQPHYWQALAKGEEWFERELRSLTHSWTNPNGEFSFENVAEGEYILFAIAEGFSSLRSECIAVREGEDITDLEISLRRQGTSEDEKIEVSGRLFGRDNSPIPQASGLALLTSNTGMRITSARFQSDVEGKYNVSFARRLTSSPPSSAEIVMDGFERATRADARLAWGVSLKDIDFIMEEEQFGSVSGKVFLPDGKTPAQAVGVATIKERDIRWSSQRRRGGVGYYSGETTITDAEGNYRLERIKIGHQRLCAAPVWHFISSFHYFLLKTFAPDERVEKASAAYKDIVVEAGKESKGIDFILTEAETVSGNVISAEDRQPLQGVRLELAPIGDRLTPRSSMRNYSNERGLFRIEFLPPGDYFLTASLIGYRSTSKRITVSAGQDIGDVIFILRKIKRGNEGSVYGKVYLPDGAPAARARVFLSWHSGEVIYRKATKPNGGFTFANVRPDRYILRARKVGYAPSRSIPIVVRKNERRDGIEIRLEEGVKVEGQIIKADGETPAAWVALAIAPRDEPAGRPYLWNRRPHPGCRFTTSDDEGRFAFQPVGSGAYEMSAIGRGANIIGLLSEVNLPTQPDQPVKDVALRLGEFKGSMAGKVVQKPDLTPIRNALIQFYRYPSRYQFRATSGEDGQYRLMGLPPGRYLVSCRAKGMTNVAIKDVVLEEDEVRRDFQLSPGGSLTGKVSRLNDRSALEGVSVSTYRRHTVGYEGLSSGLSAVSVSSDADGVFEFKHLAPGNYRVFVKSLDGTEVVKENVVVKEGERTTVDFVIEAEE